MNNDKLTSEELFTLMVYLKARTGKDELVELKEKLSTMLETMSK